MPPPTKRRRTGPVQFQPPLMSVPKKLEPVAAPVEPQEPERPTDVDGIPVVREELLFARPGAYFRISKLHLANGETVHACRDCLYVGSGRGAVMAHRNAEHGAKFGQRKPKVTFPTISKHASVDVVLPSRDDETPAPENLLQMTMGEILALMPTISALGDTIDRLETERDQALAELDKVKLSRADQHKIDVYDSHRQEILDLRLTVQKVANYEQVKDELYKLRAWKRKTVTTLSKAGFHLEED